MACLMNAMRSAGTLFSLATRLPTLAVSAAYPAASCQASPHSGPRSLGGLTPNALPRPAPEMRRLGDIDVNPTAVDAEAAQAGQLPLPVHLKDDVGQFPHGHAHGLHVGRLGGQVLGA